jgi:hypothetical protein
MNKAMKLGERLFTGKIVESESFVKSYNNLSDDIDNKDAIGMDTEALKNGRHNMFNAYAIAI